ncbi:MAG: hypothetical protein IKN44_03955 [Bacteroidaceae bacterium]|nr:hypothetical protein [Bacteroidaceae bacterium]
MKRIMLSLLMAAGMLTTLATTHPLPFAATEGNDFTYLTFETTDGTKASVAVEGLPLTINGTTLTAGSKTFTLTNLSKMYFSTTDESTTADIKAVESSQMIIDEATEIYNLQGHKISKDQMHKGIYIVKTKQGTHKIAVK